ncbi:MAG: N-6 DNA methylase [Spirochaetes bacterium]|nr:N-6 DNA methylase [Spirochaetota bacterium]
MKKKLYLKTHQSIIESLLENILCSKKYTSADLVSIFTEYGSVSDDPDISKILKLIKSWDILKQGDIIGFIYQQSESILNKKSKGQYFTPPDIVDSIITHAFENIEDFENIRICDPACGSGQFLIIAFEKLLHLYLEKGYDAEKASREILARNLFGFDIDPVAVEITVFNLKKISFIHNIKPNIMLNNFLVSDSSLESSGKTEMYFDLFIGNPPWGSRLSPEEKNYFKNNYFSAGSGVNTFTLFIEKSLDRLNKNGRISFLIPEAYLNIKAHQNSRTLVLENAQIESISIRGDQFINVYAPAVSIQLKHETSYKARHSNIVKIYDCHNDNTNTYTMIPQHHYYTTYQNIFNINYSQKAVSIISRMENQECLFLKDNATFFLGIVTGENDRFIKKGYSPETPDQIITGKDLTPYKIHFNDNYFKYDSVKLQQTAPRHLYETQSKFIYKFIGKKLTFAIDNNRYFTLNNVNGFIPESLDIDKNALLGILNSRIIQYYYQKNFFTVKVLRNNLEKLPLIKLSDDSESRIASYVEDILQTDSLYTQKNLTENIEDLLLHEYNLRDNEGYRIWEEQKTDAAQAILPGL